MLRTASWSTPHSLLKKKIDNMYLIPNVHHTVIEVSIILLFWFVFMVDETREVRLLHRLIMYSASLKPCYANTALNEKYRSKTCHPECILTVDATLVW